MRERVQDALMRARDAVMWSPARARITALAVIAAVIVLGVVSVVVAGRVNLTPAASAGPDQDAVGCREGAQAWVNAVTAPTADTDRWVAGVSQWSTPRAARWLPTVDRSLIPPAPVTVTAEPAQRGECIGWVEFGDGTRWYTSLVPDLDRGVWVVDEWDDQT